MGVGTNDEKWFKKKQNSPFFAIAPPPQGRYYTAIWKLATAV